MDRGGAWDEKINKRLTSLFGTEKFDPKKVSLSFDEKAKYFERFRQSLKGRQVKFITVAGTNGKGETSRIIQKRLKEKGMKVALWTSPHVLSVRERFIFDDKLIEEEIFEKYLKEAPGLSYYEVLFHIFCHWLTSLDELDVVIFEVGLGGRLDAVNFFDADLVCLTSISRDHCEFLGHSLKEILGEKLGVCREKTPLISCLTQEHLNKELSEFTSAKSIPWINLCKEYSNLKELPYWEQNMLSALATAGALTHGVEGFTKENVEKLPAPHISPGRFEQMTLKNRRFIFIGAHNLDGLRQLVQSVFKRLDKDSEWETLFSLSDRPDEEISAMLDLLMSCDRLKKNITFCEFEHPRALTSEKLFSLMEDRKKKGKESIKLAKDWYKQIQKEESDSSLVLGSYYFIGEVQKHLLSLGSTP